MSSRTFNPATHVYAIDGRPLPSVTQILRATGIYSDYAFAESHHKYRGSAVHAGAAILDMNGVPQLGPVPAHLQTVADEIVNGYWPAFSRFKERTGWQGRIWECPMVHPTYGFAGCFDVVGECGDEIVLLDVKSGVMPEAIPAQLALYWLLITTGLPVDENHAGLEWLRSVVAEKRPVQRWGLRLEKSGKDTVYTQTSKGESYSAPRWDTLARSLLNVYTVRAQFGLLAKERE